MVLVQPRPPQEVGPSSTSGLWTVAELVLGIFLLSGAALAGLVLIHRPWPNRLDRVGAAVLHEDFRMHLAAQVVHLGSLSALVIGVAILFLVALFRDRIRAAAILIAPVSAVLVVEHVAKPLVGRHLGDSHAFSYPSGTVTVVAGLAACAFLVVPVLLKVPVAMIGMVVVAAVSAAVVILRWHLVTDALGGACVGVGAVFVIDGLMHVGARWLGVSLRWRAR